MNNIIDLLNLKDEGIEIINIVCEGDKKIVEIEKKLTKKYCPICGCRMYSKGITVRKVRHPILQDTTNLYLYVNQRRWRCSNDNCKHEENDSYSFLKKNKQLTNLIPFLVCNELKDHTITCAQVAKRYNITSMTVFNYFMQYVDCKRLTLPKCLSIDEVYLNIDEQHKYALVLMNFENNEIIDIVLSRRKVDTDAYFYNIPIDERNNVEHLICDMYNPYINYTLKYFHQADTIIDSFHVISWINNLISQYINAVKKKYQKRDDEELEKENKKRNVPFSTKEDSKGVYIIKKFKWILLKKESNIIYSIKEKYDLKLCRHINTYSIKELFLKLDDNFETIKKYRDMYSDFNDRNIGKDEKVIESELDELITLYQESSIKIFNDFSNLLKMYKPYIIKSFKYVTNIENDVETIKRLSNGPMESFNRKPKDLKRLSRGFSNFDYVRNRILWSTRSNPAILGTPKSLDEIRPKKDNK